MTTNQNPVQTKSKARFLLTLLFGVSVFANGPAYAQVSFSINISSQPVWGPIGYDYVEYYYLPEYGIYYYVPTGVFFYPVGTRWVSSVYLPAHYHVNLYNTYKVVINDPKPYLRHKAIVRKYAAYKNRPPRQLVIRDSRDPKYYVVKGHPKYDARFIRTTPPNTKGVPRKAPADKTKTAPVKVKGEATPRYNKPMPPKRYNKTAPVKVKGEAVPQYNKTAPANNNQVRPKNMPRQNTPKPAHGNTPQPRGGGGNKGSSGGKHK
ncbi:MAG TPA: hypothetical protein VD905_14770 [Flavobacteriales bacterium]|nr:hypothetical protein [Flavobacteriales bacterium]